MVDQLNNENEIIDQTIIVKTTDEVTKNEDPKKYIEKSDSFVEGDETIRKAPKEEDFDSIRVWLKFSKYLYYKLNLS